eukprot:evm.model.scf_5.4 EVM.evm.TU.scf_5.4   scf_5:37994-42378(-)
MSMAVDQEDSSNSAAASPSEVQSGEQKAVLKLLVSNAVAGSIIGKGGATISEFQQSSQARIQLSRAGEYFPGTKERIAVISGTLHAVLTAVHLVLGKIKEEAVEEEEGEEDDEERDEEDEHLASQGGLTVKLCIPIRLCGAIIGKGGQTVRAFMDDCKADIRIQGHEQLLPGVTERLVAVKGMTAQIMRAFGLILSKLSEDPKYDEYADQPISPASRYRGPSLASLSSYVAPLAAVPTMLVMEVSNADAGAILGRRGRNIADITQESRARVKVSDRDDVNPDTGCRKVTITGSLEAVHLAQLLVCQKVGQSENAGGRYSTDGRPSA